MATNDEPIDITGNILDALDACAREEITPRDMVDKTQALVTAARPLEEVSTRYEGGTAHRWEVEGACAALKACINVNAQAL